MMIYLLLLLSCLSPASSPGVSTVESGRGGPGLENIRESEEERKGEKGGGARLSLDFLLGLYL